MFSASITTPPTLTEPKAETNQNLPRTLATDVAAAVAVVAPLVIGAIRLPPPFSLAPPAVPVPAPVPILVGGRRGPAALLLLTLAALVGCAAPAATLASPRVLLGISGTQNVDHTNDSYDARLTRRELSFDPASILRVPHICHKHYDRNPASPHNRSITNLSTV